MSARRKIAVSRHQISDFNRLSQTQAVEHII